MSVPEPIPTGGVRERILDRAAAAGVWLATAESLTAGAVVAALVDVPGASRSVAGGAACYSYAAKTRVLGVDAAELARDGAVTRSVAVAMARGALAAYGADLAVSTTGVAGPGPDERGVAAGTVHLAVAAGPRLADRPGIDRAREVHLSGDRSAVRAGAVEAALALLDEALARLTADPAR